MNVQFFGLININIAEANGGMEKNMKMRKRIASAVVAGLMMTSFFSVSATSDATRYFINDGAVVIEENLLEAKKGSLITAMVISKDIDWSDEAVWKDDSSSGRGSAEQIEYYTELTAGEDGAYRLAFSPKKNGAYTVYLGGDELAAPKTIDVVYINESSNIATISALSEADITGIADILKTKRSELGLFADIYNKTLKNEVGEFDTEKVSEIATDIHSELSALSEKDAQSVAEFIQTVMLMNMLEDGVVLDIDEYVRYLYPDSKDAEFYQSRFSAELTSDLNGKNYANTDSLKEKAIDLLILANINNNDGVGATIKLLETYSQKLGVKSGSNISKLASAILNQNGFSSISALKTFISNYKETSSGSGSAGGGGGGGSSSGNKGNTVATTPAVSLGIAEKNDNISSEDNKKVDIFSDIANVPWAKEAITELYWAGVINGKSEECFAPNDLVTREEFAKMVTAAFKMNMVDDDFPFKDVSKNDWCYPYVKTAYLAGITKGVSETLFGKGQNITRQDVCVMLCNAVKAADYKLDGTLNVSFKDENDIADYARDAVNTAAAAGIVNGNENGGFMPNGFATRAEAAKMIYYTITNMKSI